MALSIEMRVAIVGSAAALLGTLAGGGVTWWQTRDLQDRQFAREDHVRLVAAAAAAAAAGVEANRFDVARSAAEAMVQSHFYRRRQRRGQATSECHPR